MEKDLQSGTTGTYKDVKETQNRLENKILEMFLKWHFSSPLPLRELVLNFMAANSLYLGKLRRRKERKDGQNSSQISCICSAL